MNPYPSLVLGLELTWWIMRKRVLRLCCHGMKYHALVILLMFQDCLSLALKEGVPVWRTEFQGSVEQSCGNQLLVGNTYLLGNNVGLLKLLVGEYRLEQTFKRKKKNPTSASPFPRCCGIYFCLISQG